MKSSEDCLKEAKEIVNNWDIISLEEDKIVDYIDNLMWDADSTTNYYEKILNSLKPALVYLQSHAQEHGLKAGG